MHTSMHPHLQPPQTTKNGATHVLPKNNYFLFFIKKKPSHQNASWPAKHNQQHL